jgi:hypothetical protein
MHAMRAGTPPGPSAENNARRRPELRVVYRADAPVAAPPAAAPPETALPETAFPETGLPAVPPPMPARLTPVPARPVPARPVPVRQRPARPIAARQQASTPLRLTRRGRVVVAAAVVLLVAALSLIAAGAAQAISHSAAPRPAGRALAQVVVRPGQSLWSVAESADPNADTRLVIRQIVELNSLSGSTVFAGQRLWVPRS